MSANITQAAGGDLELQDSPAAESARSTSEKNTPPGGDHHLELKNEEDGEPAPDASIVVEMREMSAPKVNTAPERPQVYETGSETESERNARRFNTLSPFMEPCLLCISPEADMEIIFGQYEQCSEFTAGIFLCGPILAGLISSPLSAGAAALCLGQMKKQFQDQAAVDFLENSIGKLVAVGVAVPAVEFCIDGLLLTCAFSSVFGFFTMEAGGHAVACTFTYCNLIWFLVAAPFLGSLVVVAIYPDLEYWPSFITLLFQHSLVWIPAIISLRPGLAEHCNCSAFIFLCLWSALISFIALHAALAAGLSDFADSNSFSSLVGGFLSGHLVAPLSAVYNEALTYNQSSTL